MGGTPADVLVSALPHHMCCRVFVVPSGANHRAGDTGPALCRIPVIVRIPEFLKSNFTKTQKLFLDLNRLNFMLQSMAAPKDANSSLCVENKAKR